MLPKTGLLLTLGSKLLLLSSASLIHPAQPPAVHKLHSAIRRVTLNEPLSYTLHFVSFEVFPFHLKHECISYHERKYLCSTVYGQSTVATLI